MYRATNEGWWRKHDGPARTTPPIVARPYSHCFPTSREDLLDIVRDAERTTIPIPPPLSHAGPASLRPASVRAVGSGWGLSEAAVTEDFIVETHSWTASEALNKTLYDVVGADGCMTEAYVDWLLARASPEDANAVDLRSCYPFHVEAGTRVYELYCRLDAGDRDPRGLAARHPVLEGSWALHTAGGAGGQTIVGAFSTGTHGPDLRLAPIADAVEAIHLIGSGAREYWIERTPGDVPPLTDDGRLRDQYGDITILRDSDTFDAVVVSAGRMGIIYSVVLRAVRQYGLVVKTETSVWSEARRWLADPADEHFTDPDIRGLTVVVNPHRRDRGGDHSCFIQTMKAIATGDPLIPRLPSETPGEPDAPRGRVLRCGANAGSRTPISADDFFTSLARAPDARAALQPIIDTVRTAADWATAGVFFADLLLPGSGAVLAVAAVGLRMLQARLEEIARDFTGTLGELLAAVCDDLVAQGRYDLVEMLNEFLLNYRLAAGADADLNYAMRDGWDYSDVNLQVAADSLEVGIDAAARRPDGTGMVVAFVDRVLERTAQLRTGTLPAPVVDDTTGAVVDGPLSGRPLAFGGYLSLRFTGMSSAMIAMQQFALTCHGELAGLGGLDGNLPLLRAAEADAVRMGGTVHWGQLNSLTALQVQSMYPRLEKWRHILALLTDNGRELTFSTPFTRQRGLEVVQPRIGGLRATPAYCAAGDETQVSWDASRNPPWTSVRLEIEPATGGVIPVDLDGLAGSRPVVVAPGVNRVRLVAQTMLSRIARTEERVVEVIGVGPGSRTFHPDVPAARCETIDGERRWVAEFELAPGDWSARLKSSNMRVPPGAALPVLVRKIGGPQLLVSWTTFSAGFLEDTPMAGTWQLLAPGAGCEGAPPRLDIELSAVIR